MGMDNTGIYRGGESTELGKMSDESVTRIRFLEGYRFVVSFDLEVPSILVDEPRPTGEGLGPGPTRLLSAAIGHCLSSSLVYCLRKAKVRIKDMGTIVRLSTGRNEEGRLRVKKIDAQIELDVDEDDSSRTTRCLEIFDNYCTVTQSIMKGIQVDVKVVQHSKVD